ncbi:sporulation integral membrane protein YtvI [Parasporobacterium paucivorans]|uniref:Sporulation integral membrane protein YtvI n=1 Tax=Parasporobacterium paucivorans DSM 15970 TaxID=1122934 RepID=A0A1M6K5M4_9FIRM|nr:sporulation integral membrane protein YtvI [Parasporobacterium paucivorans]SHJ54235.1 sporulation integral membrane protein YtvI [Parasporobacterium paucivorans DSM 15970]
MEQEKKKKVIVNSIYYAILLFLAYLLLHYALPFFTPFILAFIVVWILRRPSVFLAKKVHLSDKPVSVIVVAVFYIIVISVTFLLGAKIVIVIKDIIFQIPDFFENSIVPLFESVFSRLEEIAQRMDFQITDSIADGYAQWIQSVKESIAGISLDAVKYISNRVWSFPAFFIKFMIMIICSFFLAGDYVKVTGFIGRQIPPKAKSVLNQAKKYFSGTVVIYVRSYALILFITFVELSIGFTALGIKNSLIVAGLVALLDILPIIGTGGILVPWCIIEAFKGNYPMAVGLLVLYLVITVVRNIIEPRIVGKQIGLHPLATLVSMFIGVRLFGVIGLFGFPVALSFFMYLNRTGAIHILSMENDKDL